MSESSTVNEKKTKSLPGWVINQGPSLALLALAAIPTVFGLELDTYGTHLGAPVYPGTEKLFSSVSYGWASFLGSMAILSMHNSSLAPKVQSHN